MKYRIMTTEGEWMYGEVRVLGNRLVMVLLDKKGHERHDPTMELKEETLGMHTGIENYYEGDIIKDDDEELREIVRHHTGAWALRNEEGFTNDWLKEYSDEPVISNIHETPELLEDAK